MELAQTSRVVLLCGEARRRTLALLRQAAAQLRLAIPEVEVRFDLRGQTAGQVQFHPSRRTLIRYNRQLLLENGERFLDRTVPHEVAHVITHGLYGPHIRPHGPEWRGVMGLFGADSRRCHDYDTRRATTRRLTRHRYRCACREHSLTSIRHHRILAGQLYYCRSCGQVLSPTTSV
jgi:SprT protein